MKYALFRDFTQFIFDVSDKPIRTILKGPELSVTNYRSALYKILKQRRYQI
jgi:hypothetical protein